MIRNKIDRDILRLAVPAIFSNITVPLLGLSDTFITGHMGSVHYMGAVAAGTIMCNAVFWLFGFLRAGTTGLSAEAYGRGDDELSRNIFTVSFVLAMAIGVALIVLSYPLSKLMIAILGVPEYTGMLAVRYFMLVVMSAPALLATMTVTGWMIGNQNTVYPMIVAISVNVINIVLSFTLVFGGKVGFVGVAVGTLTANWCGLLISLALAQRLSGERKLLRGLKAFSSNIDLRRFFRVNTDLMLRSACILVVPYAMTAFGGRMGDMTLAVNAVIMQFFMFFSYFMDGFAFSGEALCGKYAGAHDRAGLWSTVRHLGMWCVIMAVLFLAVYGGAAHQITGLLTDNADVVAGVDELKWVVCAVPVLSVAAFMFDGVYIGLTATRSMLLSTFAATVTYFVIIVLTKHFGVYGNSVLWLAFLTFLTLRGLILALILPMAVRRV